MKMLVHPTTRTNRPVWAAILALAAAVAVAGGGTPAGAANQQPTLQNGRLTVDAGSGNDTVALRLGAGPPELIQVDLDGDGTADAEFPRADVTSIVVDGGSGNDAIRIDESGGTFTNTIPTRIEGGSGNDTMLGGSGTELYLGGSGNDFVDGNRGNDTGVMGSGSDTFQWDPGDGSDTIEGESGFDTMLFNGAGAAERIELSAVGQRLRFTRDVGNIVMDTDRVEYVVFNALGGADLVTVNDLSATDVTQIDVDLGPDAATDNVVVNGTAGNDNVRVSGDASAVRVAGLAATVDLLRPEPGDQLRVNGLAGSDQLDASGLAAGAIGLTLVP
jgi:Ca2+-binding RTX toxin-like protein